MAQLTQGSKWSQVNNLNEQEEAARDEKGDSNALKVSKEIDRDRDSSASVKMSISSFGISIKWFNDFFRISPTSK